jgi:hypothetical protein
MPALLEVEYKVYLGRRNEFIRNHCHKFVLIKGEKVVDFYPTYEEALTAGLKQFGCSACFFIKKVCKKEEKYLVYQRV